MSTIEPNLAKQQKNKPKNSTVTEDVFMQLRDDIINGKYSPGSKLGLENLRATYGVGSSPLREALSRLAANGLVRQEIQRGFNVAPASIKDLQDITENRVRLESIALRLAIARGNDEWECNILGTQHLLAKRKYPPVRTDSEARKDWETSHRDFHVSLIEACDSYWLLYFCRLLYDQFDRYRRMSEKNVTNRKQLDSEHNEIMRLALARDADKACRLLTEHIQRSVKIVMTGLSGVT